ncbi:hypothetical protein CDIK_3568 [Cucumispora dikerogammari]|nr:hypothetical protein CDIK_3568 [Cucumispora dikerogammari]
MSNQVDNTQPKNRKEKEHTTDIFKYLFIVIIFIVLCVFCTYFLISQNNAPETPETTNNPTKMLSSDESKKLKKKEKHNPSPKAINNKKLKTSVETTNLPLNETSKPAINEIPNPQLYKTAAQQGINKTIPEYNKKRLETNELATQNTCSTDINVKYKEQPPDASIGYLERFKIFLETLSFFDI